MRASDPRYELAGLRFITVQSPSIGGRADLAVFVPDGHHDDADLPIVMLLHGVYGSFWNWSLIGGAHVVLTRMLDRGEIGPMALAMPSDGMAGEGTAYLRHATADYESWVMRDALDCVREAVPGATDHSPLLLCGASMGGFGALRLAARHPRQVTAVSAHSAITDLTDLAAFLGDDSSVVATDDDDDDIADLFAAAGAPIPRVRFDCGRDDPLLASNRRLHDRLDATGIDHQFQEFDGGHDWAYWHDRLPTSLAFFERTIGR